jgi:predicted cupin superfamily sugar epimerase
LLLSIVAEAGAIERKVLGSDLEKAERPQVVVPPWAWQQARCLGNYTLAGCTVAPGFEFSQLEFAPEGLFEP